MDNERVGKDEKEKLKSLKKKIHYSIGREQAVNLIYKGVTDIDYIRRVTGILEVDAVGILNRRNAKVKRKLDNISKERED